MYFSLSQVAYDHGFSHSWSLTILACSWILVIVTTFFLLPSFKVHQENHPEKDSSLTKKIKAPVQSVWSYVKSAAYISHILYFLIVHVWNSLILAILNVWLSVFYNRDQSLGK